MPSAVVISPFPTKTLKTGRGSIGILKT
jgi:hypothetical protein